MPGPFVPGAPGIYASPGDCGYHTWTCDPMLAGATALLSVPAAAGVLATIRLDCTPGFVATNIFMHMTTAGGTLTASQCFAGIWDGTGAFVGLTADQSTQWGGATGLLTMALATTQSGGPFTIVTPTLFVGLWFNGTTAPTFSTPRTAAAAAAINGPGAASTFRYATANTGLTTTTGPKLAALVTAAANTVPFWAAVN